MYEVLFRPSFVSLSRLTIILNNTIMKKTFSIATALGLVVPFVASAGMMYGDGYWMMGFGSVFILITWVVWLTVGILASIWLWKQINKKD